MTFKVSAGRSSEQVETPSGPPSDAPPSLRLLAREALSEADGDWSDAAARLRARIERDPALRDALLATLIDGATWALIRGAAHETRSAYTRPASEASTANAQDRIRHLARVSLYEWPLPGGQKLGDASREELTGAADFYAQLAERNGARGSWLRAIAEKVRGEKVVRDCVTEKQLETLRSKFNA